ncbi:MAG TPA: hypothetical protein VF796_26500 [Humisphaera sp.]
MSATPEAMPTVSERPAPAAPHGAQQPGQPLRLTVTAAAAAKQIAPWLAKGAAIRKHRLRDRADLDTARAEKMQWVTGYCDLLGRAFDSPAVAEACNDWVGRILPEYAPLGLFVEQFYEEMDHRLRRLQAVVDHLEDMAGEESRPAAAAAANTADAPAAKKDDHKGKALNWARLFPTAEELGGRTAEDATDAELSPRPPQISPSKPMVATVPTTKPQGDGRPAQHAAPGTLPPVVKPVGLLLVHAADDARAVCEFLADLAVTPRVVTAGEVKAGDVEQLMAGATPPGFALVWPCPADPAGSAATAAGFQFQLGFLAGRLGLTRVCLMQAAGKPVTDPASPVPSITLDAHGGWQLPLARTLKRAGVAVDLNRLC